MANMLLQVLWTVFIFIPLIVTGQEARVQVSANLIHGGLAFVKMDHFSLEQRHWTITLDHSLDSYYSVLTALTGDIDKLQQSLDQVRLQSFDTNIFAMNGHIKDLISFELTTLTSNIHEVERELADVKLTMSPVSSARTKRTVCESCATGLQFLFGAARDADVIELNRRVDLAAGSREELYHISETHMTIINSTLHATRENSLHLQKLANATLHLTEKMEQLSTSFGEDLTDISRRLHTALSVSSSVRLIQTVLQTLQLRVAELRRAWSETATGRLSPYFLPPTILSKCLSEISRKLPDNLQFLAKPDEAHYYQFYSFANVVATAVDTNKIRLFIEIPLAHTARKFVNFKILGVTTKHPTANLFSFTAPSREYLAVSQDHQYFLEFDSSDLQNCHGYDLKICKTQWPLKRIPQDSCEISAFLGNHELVAKNCQVIVKSTMEPLFYNAPNTNDWVFSVPSRTRVTFMCTYPEEDSRIDTSSQFIEGTGTITLGAHCDATIGNLVLTSRLVGQTTISDANPNSILIPKLPPVWESLNSSLALQAYIAANSSFNEVHNNVEHIIHSMGTLIESSQGVPVQQLNEMFRLASAHRTALTNIQWNVTRIAPISISGFTLTLFLFSIFIARYFIVYRAKRYKRGTSNRPNEASVPLTDTAN